MKAQFGSFSLALVHYRVHLTSDSNLTYNSGLLEQKLIEAARSWSDDLKLILDAQLSEWEGVPLFKRYGKGFFPKSYEEKKPCP